MAVPTTTGEPNSALPPRRSRGRRGKNAVAWREKYPERATSRYQTESQRTVGAKSRLAACDPNGVVTWAKSIAELMAGLIPNSAIAHIPATHTIRREARRLATANVAASPSTLRVATRSRRLAHRGRGATAWTSAAALPTSAPGITLPSARPRLFDDRELLGKRSEDITPLVGDCHQILDAHPELAWQIHTRLDCDDVAGRELVLGALGEARGLVDLDAHPVTEPVAEVVAMPGAVDDGAGAVVDRPATGSRARLVAPGQLCLEHELVDVARLGRRLADRERTR